MVSDMTYLRVLRFPSIKVGRGGYWHFVFALAISRVLVLDLVVLVFVGFIKCLIFLQREKLQTLFRACDSQDGGTKK